MSDRQTRELLRRWIADLVDREAFGQWLAACERFLGDDVFTTRIKFSGFFDELGLNEQGHQEWRHLTTGIVMVEIPAATFVFAPKTGMITISRPFLVGKYPVTQGEWVRLMGANPSESQGTAGGKRNDQGQVLDAQGAPFDLHPVENITWRDALSFCQQARLRLPTDLMWEQACRGGQFNTRYFFGDEWIDMSIYAHVGGDGPGTRAVGRKKPNQFGLYDIYGLCHEWCQDKWSDRRAEIEEGSNGFAAFGDTDGYNQPLWLNGSVEDLIFNRFGHRDRVIEVDSSSDIPQHVERVIQYGLSLPLGVTPGSSFEVPSVRRIRLDGNPHEVRSGGGRGFPRRGGQSLSAATPPLDPEQTPVTSADADVPASEFSEGTGDDTTTVSNSLSSHDSESMETFDGSGFGSFGVDGFEDIPLNVPTVSVGLLDEELAIEPVDEEFDIEDPEASLQPVARTFHVIRGGDDMQDTERGRGSGTGGSYPYLILGLRVCWG